MVERPIKKSERQIAEPNDAQEAPEFQQSSVEEGNVASSTPLPEKRKVIPPVAGKENSDSKGRKGKGSKKEEPSAPVNLALMRGPKPSKPKPPPVVAAPAEETQTDSDSAQQE